MKYFYSTFHSFSCGRMFHELTASDVLANHEKVDEVKDRYVVLFDEEPKGKDFHNMDNAVKLMMERSWRCIDMVLLKSSTSVLVHALMERSD